MRTCTDWQQFHRRGTIRQYKDLFSTPRRQRTIINSKVSLYWALNYETETLAPLRPFALSHVRLSFGLPRGRLPLFRPSIFRHLSPSFAIFEVKFEFRSQYRSRIKEVTTCRAISQSTFQTTIAPCHKQFPRSLPITR